MKSRTQEFRNELEIQFLGLQRSGNHAVLAWLFRQFDEPVHFFNNAKHFGNPLQEFQPLDLPNTVKIRRGEGRKRQLEEIGQRKKSVLAYSYENLLLGELRQKKLVPNKDAVTGISGCLWRILVLRDFPNWFASRIRYHEIVRGEFPSRRQINRFMHMWILYAREYLGETSYLADVPVATISFNRWVREDRYRVDLLRNFGVKLKDNSTSYVPDAGGGSSFDATKLSGNADQMQVFARWQYLRDRNLGEVVQELRNRGGEIDRLNNAVFGSGFEMALL
jgi:hypothetical protein